MARTLTSDLTISLGWNLSDDTRGPIAIKDASTLTKKNSFRAGDDAGQVNVKWVNTRTLAGSASETHDLTALLESVFGASLSFGFTKVRGIFVENQSTSHTLRVGAAGSNAWLGPLGGTAPTNDVAPSSVWGQSNDAGWVVDSTHKNLKIANQGAGSVTYRIGIVGSDDSELGSSSSSG